MKHILVVVDMQNDFIDGALGTKEAEAIVGRVVSKIQAFDGTIFVTMDTHGTDYLETKEGEKLPTPHCIRLSHGWKLQRDVRGALTGKDVRIIEKNSFASLKLAEEIRELAGEETAVIELVGLCTEICVVSNALLLKAYAPEAEICVDASCCAGVTPQTHQAALHTMRMCQISLAGTDKNGNL